MRMTDSLVNGLPRVVDEHTIIDLRKPSDLNLVHRSIANDWDVNQHVLDQIVEQMHVALEHYQQLAVAGGATCRAQSHVIKIVRLMVAMEARNMVDEARVPQSELPILQRRPFPNKKRRPRIDRQGIRVKAALARKAAREAAAANHPTD
jgi:hypothetical protein